MAVLFNNKEDEKKDQQGSAAPQTNAGNVGVIGPQGGSPAPSSSPNAGGTSSGRFTNLKGYLKANQGFNQAQGGLGGKVAQNLAQQGQKVQSNIAQAGQTFQNQAAQNLQGIQQGAALTQQAVADPSQFAQNEQNVAQLAKARDAVYQGPKSLLDVQGDQNQAILEARAKEFGANVAQTGTEKGRFNLLRNMFGKPTYSSGQQNLDNLLIQGDRQQLKNIQGARRAGVDVNKSLQSNITQAAQQGQNAIKEAQDIREATRGALNQRVTQEQEAINNQLKQAMQSQQKAYEDAKAGLAKGELTEEQAKLLGIAEGTRMYKVDPTQYLRKGMDATAETAATKQNYAQIAALKKLLDDAQSAEASKTLAQFSDVSKAESYKNNPFYTMDKDIYQNQLEQSERELNARLAPNFMGQQQGASGASNVEQFMEAKKRELTPRIQEYKANLAQKAQEMQRLQELGMATPEQVKPYMDRLAALEQTDLSKISGEDLFRKFLSSKSGTNLLQGIENNGVTEFAGLVPSHQVDFGRNQLDTERYGLYDQEGSNTLDQLAYERAKRDAEQRIIDREREAAGYNRLIKILKDRQLASGEAAKETEGSNLSFR